MSPETKPTAQETKEAVLWVAKEMLRTNLVEGTAGNLGARLPDGNAVLTPSSVDYTEMTLDDLVVTDLDGNVLEGERGPTTEKALHLSAPSLRSSVPAAESAVSRRMIQEAGFLPRLSGPIGRVDECTPAPGERLLPGSVVTLRSRVWDPSARYRT